MTRPDFVQFVLDTLAANWQTATFDPQPVLIDRRDSERQDTGARSREFDLTENNAIGVGDAPTTQNTPIGSAFDYQYRAGVNVRIEGLHADEWGHIDSAAAFGTLVGEARRAILAERVNPTTDDRCRHLTITDEDAVSTGERDHYRTDLTVEFFGYEDLP